MNYVLSFAGGMLFGYLVFYFLMRYIRKQDEKQEEYFRSIRKTRRK